MGNAEHEHPIMLDDLRMPEGMVYDGGGWYHDTVNKCTVNFSPYVAFLERAGVADSMELREDYMRNVNVIMGKLPTLADSQGD